MWHPHQPVRFSTPLFKRLHSTPRTLLFCPDSTLQIPIPDPATFRLTLQRPESVLLVAVQLPPRRISRNLPSRQLRNFPEMQRATMCDRLAQTPFHKLSKNRLGKYSAVHYCLMLISSSFGSSTTTQPYSMDIRNAPISEEGPDNETAMANVANTLRAVSSFPKS